MTPFGVSGRDLFSRIREEALHLESGGLWPASRTEAAVNHLIEWFGKDWLAQALEQGHPIARLLFGYPYVCDLWRLVNLIRFLGTISPDPTSQLEVIHRLKSGHGLAYRSVFEELRVLWCLHQAGLQVTKLPDHAKGKSPDLLASLHTGTTFYIEVTQLLSVENVARVERAYMQLRSHIHFRSAVEVSLRLVQRPYSERHLKELEAGLLRVLEEAENGRIAVLNKERVIRCVAWHQNQTSNPEVDTALARIGLERGQAEFPFLWVSPAAPFRVVAKLKDKAKQAGNRDTLLVISAHDALQSEDQLEEMVREVSDWIYDFPQIIGVVLFCEGRLYGGRQALVGGVDDSEVTVCSLYDDPRWSQTVILKNRFCRFPEREAVYGVIKELGHKSGWEPQFRDSDLQSGS